MFVGKTQKPQPYSRTVRIGTSGPGGGGGDIIMVLYREEGFDQDGEQGYTDTDGEASPPPEYSLLPTWLFDADAFTERCKLSEHSGTSRNKFSQ